MIQKKMILVKGSNESAQSNDWIHGFDHIITVAQNGAFLVDSAGKKYDLFDLPADKAFFVTGNLIMNSMELKELPKGLNHVIVSKDLYIDNNPLETLKNYPLVLGRTHVNPIIRYVENPSMARLQSPRDLFKDGSITKLANGHKTFFIGMVDAVFKSPQSQKVIGDPHKALISRCNRKAEQLGFNTPTCVCQSNWTKTCDPSHYRE